MRLLSGRSVCVEHVQGLTVVVSDLEGSACVNVEFKYRRNLQLFLPSQHTCSKSHLVEKAAAPALCSQLFALAASLPTLLLTKVHLVTRCQCLIRLDGATVGCGARRLHPHADQAPGTRVQRGLQPRRQAPGQRLL